MTIVHFIGAGPGAPDLITVRGLRLIERCPVCLYAGSLVPVEIVAAAPPGARVLDTAPMTLDDIVGEMAKAVAAGKEVARVHSGDPSLYGAIAEQIRRLKALGIAYDVTPGVPSFAAAAAALGRELTIPEVTQTVILTRTAMKSSAMPAGEDLATLARSRRDAGDPSLGAQSPGGGAPARAVLRAPTARSSSPTGRLAGRGVRVRHARRHSRRRCGPPRSPARR